MGEHAYTFPKHVKVGGPMNFGVTRYGFVNGPYEVTRIASCKMGGSSYFLLDIRTNKERVEITITGTGKIAGIHRIPLLKGEDHGSNG